MKEDRSVDALVAAAHELKAPLVLMRHLAGSLGDKTLALSDREKQQHLERLTFTAERMLRLTQHLTVNYRRAGQAQFDLEPVNVATLCEEALHELTPYAAAHGQVLQLKNKKRHQLALAQRDILHDIVINLVDNAIQHNPAGGRVEVGALCYNQHVRLGVHDSGPGLGASELTDLKKTVGTQPQPLSGRSGSSGLGLYIVGQLAASMGGGLTLGRPNQGATFIVNLIRSRQMSLL